MERVQPDVAAAVKEAIDVRNRCLLLLTYTTALSVCVLAPRDGFLLHISELCSAVDTFHGVILS